MFALNTAVIHSFKKLAHTEFVGEVVKKNVILQPDNPALQSLVEGINGLIGKEGNSVVYGQFAADDRQGPFPDRFADFVTGLGEDGQFIDLTHLAMDELVDQASKQVLSTGGHILCAQYTSSGENFFLVASMKERGAIQLDKDYVPTAIQEIDLSKVQQAARINVNRFKEIFAAEQAAALLMAQEKEDVDAAEEELDVTYLCFISRGRDSQASDYFIAALGCAKGVASGRATKNAIDQVYKFFRNKNTLKPLAYRAKDAVVRYLQKQLEEGKSARLDAICHVAGQHVPAELVEDIIGLKDYLNHEKNRVPDDFTVNATSLRQKTRIKGEASNWVLQFDRGALGEDPAADVYFDVVKRKLTLSNLSADLVALIDKELKARAG